MLGPYIRSAGSNSSNPAFGGWIMFLSWQKWWQDNDKDSQKKHKKGTKLRGFELVLMGVSWPFYWNKAIAFKQNMTNSGFWAILSVSQASLATQYTAPVARTANLEKSHTIDQLECTSSGIYQLKGGAGFPPMVGASELGCKLSQATSFLQFFFGVVLSAFQSCSTWDVSIKQCFK